MSLLEKIISFLQFKMNTPTNYGWFHIMCLLLMILLIIVLVIKKPNCKKTILIMSIIMICFEIYKQLSYSYNDGIWKYQWYAFPYQFCSTPMYVAFLLGITKNKKIEDYLYSFLVTYSLVGGIAVMLYPNTVFISETLINIQTMVHHGLMVVMGMFILITKPIRINYKTINKAFIVFMVLILVALCANIITYYIHLNNGLELFYISPFHTSTLPVFNVIYEKVPYVIFLLIYISIFTIGCFLPLLFCKKGDK